MGAACRLGMDFNAQLRYYSQSAANFYQPYLTSQQAYIQNAVDDQGREVWVEVGDPNSEEFFRDDDFNLVDSDGEIVDESELNVRNKKEFYDPDLLPEIFSSDYRLSGFGTISTGISISKQFMKGFTLQGAFEYYLHDGSLKLGGNGEDSFSNFDSYSVNAAIIVDINALSQSGGFDMPGDPSEHDHNAHAQHSGHTAPAGVMYSHMLPNAGDMMVGYRYMFGRRDGDILHGTQKASDQDCGCQWL